MIIDLFGFPNGRVGKTVNATDTEKDIIAMRMTV
jgi:hypothetical protein